MDRFESEKKSPQGELQHGIPDSADDPSRSDEPIAYFYGRFGTFLLNMGKIRKPTEEIYYELADALKTDVRVTVVSAGDLSPEWSEELGMYPAARHQNTEALLSGSDQFEGLRFAGELMFEIVVPIKNQPRIGGSDDVPSDRYWAVWDGVTLLVIWRRDPNAWPPPMSGGHVVEDILRTAINSLGADLLVQPCDPLCTHMFSHCILRITQWDEIGNSKLKVAPYANGNAGTAQLNVSFTGSPMETVELIHGWLAQPSALFAEYKNCARRLLDIEHLARELAAQLLLLDYRVLETLQGNLFTRIVIKAYGSWRFLRTGVSDRRRSKQIIASMWIAMLGIEALKRDWQHLRRVFMESAETGGRNILYDLDLKDDDLAVETIDTQFVRAAVENRASRLDNRAVAWATLGGAVFGAVLVVAGSYFLT